MASPGIPAMALPGSPATPGEVVYRQGEATLTVRREYCKGCRLCLEACPRNILALDEDDLITVTDIDACLFCGACAGRCPDFVFVLDRGGDRALGRPRAS